jgi:hypothetical protein
LRQEFQEEQQELDPNDMVNDSSQIYKHGNINQSEIENFIIPSSDPNDAIHNLPMYANVPQNMASQNEQEMPDVLSRMPQPYPTRRHLNQQKNGL